jgi:hypothetical protein
MGFHNFACPNCRLSSTTLGEMLRNHIGFESWTNKKRLTKTTYYLSGIEDEKITFLLGNGNKSWPVSYNNFSVLHEAVCNRIIDNTPAELEKFKPTHCECYISSLFKHFQNN